MKRFGYPKSRRLVSNRQFKAVLDHRQRAANSLLTLFVARNACGHPRLGVSVGRSCGNAVVRNRLKRLLREAFRQAQDRIPQGYDYVLLLSPALVRRLSRADRSKQTLVELGGHQVRESFLALVGTLLGTAPPSAEPAESEHDSGGQGR